MDEYEKLTASFEPKAYSIDDSRGFPLASIKAQYIKERLNEVFGIFGWEFKEAFKTGDKGVICNGELTVSKEGKTRSVWATGGAEFRAKQKYSDPFKSAATDALSKAASFIGVGNDVFKGLLEVVGSRETGWKIKTPPQQEKTTPHGLKESELKGLLDKGWTLAELKEVQKLCFGASSSLELSRDGFNKIKRALAEGKSAKEFMDETVKF